MRNAKQMIKDIIAIVPVVFAICIYAPIEIFIMNKNEFWFGLGDIMRVILIVTLVCCATLLIPILLLKRKATDIYTTVLSVLTLCIYIQGNFVGIRVGVMNGADIEWSLYLLRMFINLLAWIVLFTLFLVLCYKKEMVRRIILNVAVIIFGIQIFTLTGLLVQYCRSEKEDKSITSTYTDENLYTVNKDDNVIIFILDMFDAEYFDTILTNNPQWSEQLDGFVLYDNFSGTYSTTTYSLAHLYTGKMFFNEKPLSEWIEYIADDRLYVDELLDEGFKLYYYSTIEGTIPSRLSKVAMNYYVGKCNVNNYPRLAKKLYMVVAFKYFPDCFKPLLWFDGYEFEALRECEEASIYLSDNARFRDGIRTADWNEKDEKAIKYIYTVGSHYPYRIDRYGKDVHIGEVTAVECAEGVLQIIDEYLKHIKEAGTYDNTTIIITADHGYYWDGTLQSPVMLIKPQNNRGRLKISNSPVCQADFAATVLELANVDNYSSYGYSMLHVDDNDSRERFFYQYYLNENSDNGNYRLIEYSIDSNSRQREWFKLTGDEYKTDGMIIDHNKYCETCQTGGLESYDRDFPRLIHKKNGNYPR